MERDFAVLTRIGYVIRYNRELQRYDFYDDIDPDYYYIDGVFIDSETSRLCRHCGSNYDMPLQNNYPIATKAIREGIHYEEWLDAD